jgi:hypothetical protein
MLLCHLASANGHMTYPRASCYRTMRSNGHSVHHAKMMSIEIRSMRLADIPDAAELLMRTFAPDGYNAIQSAIVYKETVSGLTERLNQTMLLCAVEDGVIVGSVEAFTPAFLSDKQVAATVCGRGCKP